MRFANEVIIIIVVLGLISAGCSTTTYLSLEENDKVKVRRELSNYEKDKDVGAEVTLVLVNGKEVEGELLFVRDSALIFCTEYSATEEELENSFYPVILIKNNVISEIIFEGSSYVWTGLGAGFLAGAIIGALIGKSSDEPAAGFAGAMLGEAIGITAGGIAGYALSKEEFILYKIPPGYSFYFLKDLARYKEAEPAYLETIY